jgi:hypothetical protein
MDAQSTHPPVPPAQDKRLLGVRKEIRRQVNGIALVMTYGAILAIGGIIVVLRYPFVQNARPRT